MFDTPGFTGEKIAPETLKRLASREFVDRLAKRGRDSNEFRVRCEAQFPSESDDGVVSLGDLERAHENELEPGLPIVIGVDVARFGSDATCIAVRRGNVIRIAQSFNGRDLMATSGAVLDTARRLRDESDKRVTIVVDDVGVGGGVVDRLREINEFRVVEFSAGRKAERSSEYANARSELWFLFSDALSVIDLDPGDEDLSADLLAPSYSLTSAAQRVVEQKVATKKRLRRSPDRADAALMTCFVEPPLAPGRARRRRGSIAVPKGRIPIRVSQRRQLVSDGELASAIGVGINPSSSRQSTRLGGTHRGDGKTSGPPPAGSGAEHSSVAARGRSLDEVVASTRYPREVLAQVLQEERSRGNVTMHGGKWHVTEQGLRRYGNFNL